MDEVVPVQSDQDLKIARKRYAKVHGCIQWRRHVSLA